MVPLSMFVVATSGSVQHKSWSKLLAPLNMSSASVRFEGSHVNTLPLNATAERNILAVLVTLATDHLLRSRLKDPALLNIESMVTTSDTVAVRARGGVDEIRIKHALGR